MFTHREKCSDGRAPCSPEAEFVAILLLDINTIVVYNRCCVDTYYVHEGVIVWMRNC